MSTIAEKLQYLNDTKTAIKDAIVEKGVEVAEADTFRSYADKIRSISSGGSSYKIAPTSLSFQNRSDVTDLSFLSDILDTSNMVSFGYMFQNCKNLESLDVSGWDTSAVTNMSSIFQNCSGLQSLDVSGWDVSKVASLNYMFTGCKAMTDFKGRNMDWSSCTEAHHFIDMSGNGMNIDMSGCKTPVLTNIASFCSQGKYDTIDLSGWDTSKVTNMSGVFGYSTVNSINIDGWSTESVTGWGAMFACNAKTLILGEGFFKSALTSIEISMSNWTDDSVRTSLVTNSYDRAANGLDALTIKLSSQTKAVLTDEDKATMTSKGYVIA